MCETAGKQLPKAGAPLGMHATCVQPAFYRHMQPAYDRIQAAYRRTACMHP